MARCNIILKAVPPTRKILPAVQVPNHKRPIVLQQRTAQMIQVPQWNLIQAKERQAIIILTVLLVHLPTAAKYQVLVFPAICKQMINEIYS